MIEVNKIYNMDCIEGMKEIPDNSIHLIVTDPPYGLSYNNGDLANYREQVFGGKLSNQKPRPIINDLNEEQSFDLFKKMLVEAKRVLVKGGCCCCCCCGGGPKPLFAKWTLLMDEILNFTQAIVWDKGGLGMGIHYRRNYEFILIAQKGSPCHTWNGGNNTPNVWCINKIIPSEHQHPTEKPVELMNKIIEIHSNKGDTVLDPFIGTGASMVSAKRLGRKFIGFEIDKKFYDIAFLKINNTKEQMRVNYFGV